MISYETGPDEIVSKIALTSIRPGSFQPRQFFAQDSLVISRPYGAIWIAA
jgi:hypothetical protein